jgi:hypothetical protein
MSIPMQIDYQIPEVSRASYLTIEIQIYRLGAPIESTVFEAVGII